MFQLPDYLWPPQRRGIERTIDALLRGKDVCLQGPCGSGKLTVGIQLLRWAVSGGLGGCFYLNRRLLIGQSSSRFAAEGLEWHGIRAAGYDDKFDDSAPVQICSADTEASRVIENATWKLHNCGPGGVVVWDEAHIQRTQAARNLIRMHKANGSLVVLLTATPVGLSSWANELIVSGTMQEYRDCGAIVPAITKSLSQPDLRKVSRNESGEYILDGKKKKIYTQTIVSDVFSAIDEFNPDLRPIMLYAPGKPESVWFCNQFLQRGINACHIDATDAVLDGVRMKLTRTVWEDISGRFKDGSIKAICSRFKAREGLDFPFAYHCILATPIGSLASMVQTTGRVMRKCEGKDHALITDHGGNYHRHGSPNHDKPWEEWWTLPEHAVSNWHENQIKNGKAQEAIRCPNCKSERATGISCPQCGHTHPKSQREVIMEDGTLETHDGELIKPRKVQKRYNTQDLWNKLYWGYKKNGIEKSFAQMYGYFVYKNHYHPPRDLNFMPKRDCDWHVHVPNLAVGQLRGAE